MKRAVVSLAAAQVALGGLLLAAGPAWTAAGRGASPGEMAAFAVAFAVAGAMPIQIDLRRGSLAVVLDEAVWVVALFAMGPLAGVAAAVAGAAFSRLATRQVPLKTAYNLASTFLATAAGATVFVLVERLVGHGAGEPLSWVALIAATATLSTCSLMSTAAVLTRVEARPLRELLAASAGPQLAATAGNASVGIAVALLYHAAPLAPLAGIPLLSTVVLASRRQALQRSQELRFQRLYRAAARTSRLTAFDGALTALAAEARSLVTGSTGVCCARRPGAPWVGAVEDDSGSRPADPPLVAVLSALAADRPGGTVTVTREALGEGTLLPPGQAVIVAAGPDDSEYQVLLAVFRETASDEQTTGRNEVLSAFTGHAALVVANAGLYEDVEEALRRQVDLNRQKGEFVAAVSHELRTPLTTVIGAVATVRRLSDRLDDAKRDDLLARALEQGDRLRRLIDELLLVAAVEHGRAEATAAPVDVGHLVGDSAAEFAGRAGGRLVVDVPPAPLLAFTDAEKLRRIVTNLIENAVKYAPVGAIEVRAHALAGDTTVTVTDHGPGIAPADRERVFEPFVQLDGSSTRRQGGTGLGLHLCRQLTGIIGAKLTLDETPGGGCHFELCLPGEVVPATSESAVEAGVEQEGVLV